MGGNSVYYCGRQVGRVGSPYMRRFWILSNRWKGVATDSFKQHAGNSASAMPRRSNQLNDPSVCLHQCSLPRLVGSKGGSGGLGGETGNLNR